MPPRRYSRNAPPMQERRSRHQGSPNPCGALSCWSGKMRTSEERLGRPSSTARKKKEGGKLLQRLESERKNQTAEEQLRPDRRRFGWVGKTRPRRASKKNRAREIYQGNKTPSIARVSGGAGLYPSKKNKKGGCLGGIRRV